MGKIRILYVYTTSVISDLIDALKNLDYEVEVYPDIVTTPFPDNEMIDRLAEHIDTHSITHIMSIDIQDNLALAAKKSGIKYVSVIWDAPYFKLYSPYGRMECCYFSVFDQKDYARCKERRTPHIIYQPLSVERDFMTSMYANMDKRQGKQQYLHDICFIGGLYEENFYDEFMMKAPSVLQDYFISIFEEAAFKWDGTDHIYGKTSPEIIEYMRRTVPGFEFINLFEIEDTELFERTFLVRKIANIERIAILNLLAENYHVTLYTHSQAAREVLSEVEICPPVNPTKEAFEVFGQSKINLNLSLKGIERGTPLRVINICAAGGFALTNYCPETAELFEEDKEIVMFRSPEELIEKTDYYLTHEAEREAIAKAGYEKVLRCYTSEEKCRKLMEWVESEG